MPGFLVFLVVDEVDDLLAVELRRRVRALAASRSWRDRPPGDRAASGDARASCAAVQSLSGELEVDVELQWHEVTGED